MADHIKNPGRFPPRSIHGGRDANRFRLSVSDLQGRGYGGVFERCPANNRLRRRQGGAVGGGTVTFDAPPARSPGYVALEFCH